MPTPGSTLVYGTQVDDHEETCYRMSQSMLQSHTHKVKGTRTLGYLVAVEVDDTAEFAPTSERIALALAGALTWMEGVGPVDVDELGEIETIEPKHDDWGV